MGFQPVPLQAVEAERRERRLANPEAQACLPSLVENLIYPLDPCA